MRNDVYDYTATGQVAKNTVLQKTYCLLGLSFIPAVAGAYFSGRLGLNLFSLFGHHLGRRTQRAQERVLRVGGPARQNDAVDLQRGQR